MMARVRKAQRQSAKAGASEKRRLAAGSKPARPRQKPIDFYFWPTPNGWKIAIMLEECRLPYTMHQVNIDAGEQFHPDFLKISPNNRMPAIVDPRGPGGRPISVFESGAILQYLGRKTGKFYPREERARVEVEQWLMWQMGGLGPMAGQAHHFRRTAPEKIPYAIERYTNECNRLYRVMNERLADRPFIAGKYSIADIAIVGWARRHERHGQDWHEFPRVRDWYERVNARPAVARGMGLRVDIPAATTAAAPDSVITAGR